MSTKADIDALLVDWLYGELDEEGQARFDAYLDESPDARAEAEALARTRDAFRELEDAEPPAALSAILLHEAAVRAPQAETSGARRGGFFAGIKRFFQPIALHPGLAAVATLVVVGGAVGTLYLRQGDEALQPATSETLASAPSSGEAPAAEPVPARDAEESEGRRVDTLTAAAEDAPEGALAGLDRERALEEQKKSARKDARAANQPAATSAKPKPRSRSGSRGYADPMANAVSGADALDEKSRDSVGVVGSQAQSGMAADADEGDVEYTWASRREADLEKAISRNRCLDASKIAGDILDRNPDYYRDRVDASKKRKVRDCEEYLAEQSKRRKSKRSAPKRESAEPAPSDALEEADAKGL